MAGEFSGEFPEFYFSYSSEVVSEYNLQTISTYIYY